MRTMVGRGAVVAGAAAILWGGLSLTAPAGAQDADPFTVDPTSGFVGDQVTISGTIECDDVAAGEELAFALVRITDTFVQVGVVAEDVMPADGVIDDVVGTVPATVDQVLFDDPTVIDQADLPTEPGAWFIVPACDSEAQAAFEVLDSATTSSSSSSSSSSSTSSSTSSTTPSSTSSIPFVDKDCEDFTSQAAAQAELDKTPGADPHGLDSDRDRKACEAFTYSGGKAIPRTGSESSTLTGVAVILLGAGFVLVGRSIVAQTRS